MHFSLFSIVIIQLNAAIITIIIARCSSSDYLMLKRTVIDS